MSETPPEAPAEQPPTPPAQQPPPEQQPPGDPDDKQQLGEAGKKALDQERANRKEAEKRAKTLERELEQVREATKSEQEKALDAARKEGRAEAQKENAPRLVRAEFRAAVAGRMSSEQLDELLEDLDLSKYLTDSGDVDTERVAKKIDALAPQKEERRVPFNGGPRQSDSKPEPTPGLGRLRTAYTTSSKR